MPYKALKGLIRPLRALDSLLGDPAPLVGFLIFPFVFKSPPEDPWEPMGIPLIYLAPRRKKSFPDFLNDS